MDTHTTPPDEKDPRMTMVSDPAAAVPVPALSDMHRGYLTDHAISDEVIASAGIWSEGDDIVFPWRDGGLLTRQRRTWPEPPGGLNGHKYLWESGRPLHFWALRPVEGLPSGAPVIIAEGTKQSLAVASWAPDGYAVYGMAGCDGWRDLTATGLARFDGHPAVVLLDADAGENLRVYEAGEKLAAELALEGADPAFVPSPAWGKGGIDDYLAAAPPDRRAAKLARLLAGGQPRPAKRRPKPPNGQRVADGSATGATPEPFLSWEVAQVAPVALPAGALANMLEEALGAVRAYVWFASDHHAVAVVLYAAATHAVRSLQAATRLRVTSPVMRCGKSRLLDVIECLVRKPLPAVSISAAALVRSIGADPCTIILDEQDAVFTGNAKGDEKAEALRAILDGGFGRGKPYVRYSVMTEQVESWPTFAMVILAGIGELPDTITDRAITIPMARKTAGDGPVARFRMRRDPPALKDLGARLGSWIAPVAEWIGTAEPVMPPGLDDRAEDAWEPLIAVADAAGGRWPQLAREACSAMADAAARNAAGASPAIRLLADVRDAFAGADRMHTVVLLARLHAASGAPWSDWSHGRALSDRQLADLLRPFGAEPRDVKIDGANRKGYYRSDFTDAWARYEKLGPVAADYVTYAPQPTPVQGPAPVYEPPAPASDATAATGATPQVSQGMQVAPVAPSAATSAPLAAPAPFIDYSPQPIPADPSQPSAVTADDLCRRCGGTLFVESRCAHHQDQVLAGPCPACGR